MLCFEYGWDVSNVTSFSLWTEFIQLPASWGSGGGGVVPAGILQQYPQLDLQYWAARLGVSSQGLWEQISLHCKFTDTNCHFEATPGSWLWLWGHLPITNAFQPWTFVATMTVVSFLLQCIYPASSWIFDDTWTWLDCVRCQWIWQQLQILIGNKCDMESKRVVPKAKGQQLADEFGIHFFETSAKVMVLIPCRTCEDWEIHFFGDLAVVLLVAYHNGAIRKCVARRHVPSMFPCDGGMCAQHVFYGGMVAWEDI